MVGVIAQPADHGIRAALAVEHVGRIVADQVVVGAVAGRVDRRRAGQDELLLEGAESARDTGYDRIEAAAAAGLAHHVTGGVDVIGVITQSAAHGVGARAAVEGVVTAATDQRIVAGKAAQQIVAVISSDGVGMVRPPHVLDFKKQITDFEGKCRCCGVRDLQKHAWQGAVQQAVREVIDRAYSRYDGGEQVCRCITTQVQRLIAQVDFHASGRTCVTGGVDPAAAPYDIEARAASEQVVASPANQQIQAVPSIEGVVTAAANQKITACLAIYLIISSAAVYPVIGGRQACGRLAAAGRFVAPAVLISARAVVGGE
ncbi:hypothetical protein D9M68_362200 [compost metagenome]